MRWSKVTSMISAANEYSNLTWPLTFASILTTLLAFILLLGFRSDSWFIYELLHTDNNSIISNITYSRLLEYGSVGLWKICSGRFDAPDIKCEAWTAETRPHSFNVIIVLVSCALFLSNLTVFPSWGSSILILYNSNNRYTRPIIGFIWVLFFLTLSYTILLMIAISSIALTQFYSPGKFIIDTKHLFFYSHEGLFYAGLATILAIFCLMLVIITLIWKKMIDTRLLEVEKDLLRQITDDSYRPGWHKIAMAPRTTSTSDPINEPPPYEY